MSKGNNHHQVVVGDKVLVILNGEAKELEIVDVAESNPKLGRISWLTPLAQALLGKTFPEKVKVKLPSGELMDCQLVRIV
jgi:transcription elongation GreA/GreB family factor